MAGRRMEFGAPCEWSSEMGSQSLSWSRWCWRKDPDVCRHRAPTAVLWSHRAPEQDWTFSKWITKPGKPCLLYQDHYLEEEKGKKRVDSYGCARFSQGKGTVLRVPGLLLISVWVFGFQPLSTPISPSLSPQENVRCSPRHPTHTTGTAGRVLRLWPQWDVRHTRWLVPSPPASLPPSSLGLFCFFKPKMLCREKQPFLVVCVKSPAVSLTM